MYREHVWYLYNRSNEFFKKAMLQKGWPIVMNKIDQQAFNVGSILILNVKKNKSVNAK